MEQGNQFKGVHTWKKANNAMGQRVERSTTPHGTYTISGHGAGKLKWSAHRDLNEDTSESAWEVLGSTKREVLAESDLNLKSIMEKKNG